MRRPSGIVLAALAPVVAVLGFASISSGAATSHAVAHSTKTYTIAYEGPLSGGNQQLGLNMEYAVALAIKQANAGTTFGTFHHVVLVIAATAPDTAPITAWSVDFGDGSPAQQGTAQWNRTR